MINIPSLSEYLKMNETEGFDLQPALELLQSPILANVLIGINYLKDIEGIENLKIDYITMPKRNFIKSVKPTFEEALKILSKMKPENHSYWEEPDKNTGKTKTKVYFSKGKMNSLTFNFEY